MLNKQVLKKMLPAPLSRAWRQGRDELKYRRLKPYATRYGFKLYGDRNLDGSREASAEIETVARLL